jgi:hypothetical protein
LCNILALFLCSNEKVLTLSSEEYHQASNLAAATAAVDALLVGRYALEIY